MLISSILYSYFILLKYGMCQLTSEKERQQKGVADTCGCLWVYLAHLRSGADGSHVHCNPFFDPVKYDGQLLPPAAALAPTLWPQFHLRWACPSEAGPDEIQSQWRTMTKKFSETSKVSILLIPLGLFRV